MKSTLVGVLQLDTRFPRLPGDAGAAETWGGDCMIERIAGATVPRVVRPDLDADTIEPFVAGARRLEAAGAGIVVTSCGFLWPAAELIRGAVTVPVVVSALEALPALRRQAGPDRPIGILTFDSRVLQSSPLDRLDPGALASGLLVVEGIETGRALHRTIAEDLDTLDPEIASADVCEAAARLISRAPDMFAVILECTNLPPYRDAIEKVVDIPVVDAVGMVRDIIDELSTNC